MGVTVNAPREYELYDDYGWIGRATLAPDRVAAKREVGYRVVEAVTDVDGHAQPDVNLTASAIQKALDDPIDVPHECVCAYVRIMPYGLVQRHANANCTEHSPNEPDGELEKDRD